MRGSDRASPEGCRRHAKRAARIAKIRSCESSARSQHARQHTPTLGTFADTNLNEMISDASMKANHAGA